jgi:hypothetical protein
MALTPKGNTSLTLQVGARGPVADPVYHLSTREETWNGKREEYAAFVAVRPFGSVHPTFPVLRLAEIEPRYLEAGMMDVWLKYAGSNSSGGPATKRYQSLLKTASTAIKFVRSFERVASISVFNGVTTKSWGPVVQEIEGEMVYQYYTPSVTYRYCSNVEVKAAQFGGSAAIDLGGVTPTASVLARRQTGQLWVMRSGMETSSNLSGVELRNLQTMIEFPNGSEVGSPVTRAADVVCEPVGLSGWFTVDETWEVELV